MKYTKGIFFFLSFFVVLATGLMMPAYSFAVEKIGNVIAVKGSIKIFNARSKFLMDLKSNDEIYSGDIIVTGSKAGVQIAVSHHTSVSVGSGSLVVINRRIDKRKKESHHITLLRGRARTTSYGKILLESADKKIHVGTPYGIFSFNGADLVVNVSSANASAQGKGTVTVPCPSQVKVSGISKLGDVLIDGALPKKSSVAMEKCPEGSKNEEVMFVGFQKPKIKKKMISQSDIALINTWIIAGEVGYTPPSKKRPVITLKGGEKIAFDGEGKAVIKD